MKKVINKYGKEIDLQKLKPKVLSSLEAHLHEIQEIVDFLKNSCESIEQGACYVCNSREREPFSEIYDFEYIKCSSCSHVYTTKRYTEKTIQEFYKTNQYYSKTTYADKESCYYRRENVAKPKAEFFEQFVSPSSNRTWLDVGSGIGDLVSVLSEKGWNVDGVELSESSITFAEETFGVSLQQTTLEDFVAQNKETKYDAVSFIGVLEHVVNPVEHLEMAASVLNNKGIIAIQVPNALSLTSYLQALFPQNVFRHMSPIEHIMLFSKNSLCKALGIIGFEPLAFWWHGMDIYELLNNMTLVNPKIHDSEFSKQIMDSMNGLQFVLDGKELSDRIICVARKS